MNEADRKARDALLRLVDAHIDDVLSTPDEDIVAEAGAEGIDLGAEARRVDDAFSRAETAVGQQRMKAARAAMDAYRRKAPASAATPRLRPANDIERLTLAARNGKQQSERDRRTVQEDMDELDSFDDGKALE